MTFAVGQVRYRLRYVGIRCDIGVRLDLIAQFCDRLEDDGVPLSPGVVGELDARLAIRPGAVVVTMQCCAGAW